MRQSQARFLGSRPPYGYWLVDVCRTQTLTRLQTASHCRRLLPIRRRRCGPDACPVVKGRYHNVSNSGPGRRLGPPTRSIQINGLNLRNIFSRRSASASTGRPVSASTVGIHNAERENIRLQAIETNKGLSYALNDNDADSRFRIWRERDPYPHVPPALLNSADIADYVARTGMLYPFYPRTAKVG